jgi:hypothetical protein
MNLGQLMHPPLGENDSAALNVTVWEGGQVSKKDKMSHRDNISQYGKRDVMKQMGKCLRMDVFHNPNKKG